MSDALPLFWSSMPSRRITKSKLLTPLDFPPPLPSLTKARIPPKVPKLIWKSFLSQLIPVFHPAATFSAV